MKIEIKRHTIKPHIGLWYGLIWVNGWCVIHIKQLSFWNVIKTMIINLT